MKLFILILLITINCRAEKLTDFKLPLYKDSSTFSYPTKKNKKTLINFWASWCTACIQEIPELEALKTNHRDVEFLAINAGDSKSKIKKFLKRTGFSYKVLMDKNKSFSKGQGVLSLPITMVVNSNGDILYKKAKPPKNLNELK